MLAGAEKTSNSFFFSSSYWTIYFRPSQILSLSLIWGSHHILLEISGKIDGPEERGFCAHVTLRQLDGMSIERSTSLVWGQVRISSNWTHFVKSLFILQQCSILELNLKEFSRNLNAAIEKKNILSSCTADLVYLPSLQKAIKL